jgi:predicted small secreted protein
MGRNDPVNDLLRRGLGLVGVLLLAGCNTVGGLTRDTADSTRLVYESSASAVFTAAVAAVGDHLEITSQDQRLGEIRLRRESHMNGILLCHGQVMAVFLSPDGGTRTSVEIVERTLSRLQPVGCQAQTPAYVERLNAKLGVVRPTRPDAKP